MKKLLVLAMVAALCLTVAFAATAETYGFASVTSIAAKAAYTDDGEAYDGSVQANVTTCLLVLGDDGKIAYVYFDMIQPKATFSTEGAITSDASAEIKTKKELGDAYGMIVASSIGKEWYQQAEALEAYCVGKTVEEVLTTPTYVKNDSHPQVPDDADLKTSVTIDIGSFLTALQKAAENAK